MFHPIRVVFGWCNKRLLLCVLFIYYLYNMVTTSADAESRLERYHDEQNSICCHGNNMHVIQKSRKRNFQREKWDN
jgi:hypothetical protein